MRCLGKNNNMIQELQILGNEIQIGLQMMTDSPNKHGQDQRMTGTRGPEGGGGQRITAASIPLYSLPCIMSDDTVTSLTLAFM